MLGVLDIVVWKEHDLEPVTYNRIIIDDLGESVNELDNEFCHDVSGGSFSAKNKGARGHVSSGVTFESQVERENMQHVEMLPLVFVDSLRLDIEE